MMQLFGAQALHIYLQSARAEELLAASRDLVDCYPEFAAWRAGLVLIHLGSEAVDDAERELDKLLQGSVRSLPARHVLDRLHGPHRAGPCARSPSSGETGAEDLAALYRELAPYEDRIIVAGGAVAVLGRVALPLGLLASRAGRDGAGARAIPRPLAGGRRRSAAARQRPRRTSNSHGRCWRPSPTTRTSPCCGSSGPSSSSREGSSLPWRAGPPRSRCTTRRAGSRPEAAHSPRAARGSRSEPTASPTPPSGTTFDGSLAAAPPEPDAGGDRGARRAAPAASPRNGSTVCSPTSASRALSSP